MGLPSILELGVFRGKGFYTHGSNGMEDITGTIDGLKDRDK